MFAQGTAALKAAGLAGKYEETFKENAFDDETLGQCIKAEGGLALLSSCLNDAISVSGHRLKFIIEFRKILEESSSTLENSNSSPPSPLSSSSSSLSQQQQQQSYSYEEYQKCVKDAHEAALNVYKKNMDEFIEHRVFVQAEDLYGAHKQNKKNAIELFSSSIKLRLPVEKGENQGNNNNNNSNSALLENKIEDEKSLAELTKALDILFEIFHLKNENRRMHFTNSQALSNSGSNEDSASVENPSVVPAETAPTQLFVKPKWTVHQNPEECQFKIIFQGQFLDQDETMNRFYLKTKEFHDIEYYHKASSVCCTDAGLGKPRMSKWRPPRDVEDKNVYKESEVLRLADLISKCGVSPAPTFPKVDPYQDVRIPDRIRSRTQQRGPNNNNNSNNKKATAGPMVDGRRLSQQQQQFNRNGAPRQNQNPNRNPNQNPNRNQNQIRNQNLPSLFQPGLLPTPANLPPKALFPRQQRQPKYPPTHMAATRPQQFSSSQPN